MIEINKISNLLGLYVLNRSCQVARFDGGLTIMGHNKGFSQISYNKSYRWAINSE